MRRDWHVDTDGFIRGVAINRSRRPLAYAQIEFRLLNQRHAQVDTTMCNTTHLETNQEWDFECPYLKTFYSAQLIKATGW